MIVFDLSCGTGHVFEAWFGSSADYEDQRARGLLACPICGATEVDKAVMAPNVAPKGNSQAANVPVPMQAGAPAPAEMKAMLAALARAQAKMLEGSEHVGSRFATEARALSAIASGGTAPRTGNDHPWSSPTIGLRVACSLKG